MKKIATLNKISPVGLDVLNDNYTIVDDVNEAEGIILRSADMHEMEFSSNLLAIARAGAGVNNIPLDRCAEEGIVVFNTPGANANAVKELVIGAMIMSARNMATAKCWVDELQENVLEAAEKGKGQFAGQEIMGKTLGVIGLGAIGVMVANTAQLLGMKVIGYDPYITLTAAHNLSNSIPVTSELGEMLKQCDYITIHVPANDNTKGMIDARRFAQMKDGVIFLNFARNTLVNEDALIEALNSGKVYKYTTDFLTDKLMSQKGVYALPHLGASTKEAEDNCAIMAAKQLMDYLENGNITNSVNYPACSMGPINKDAHARMCIANKNVPGMLGKITGKLAELNINARDLTNKSRGEYAYTMIDIDSEITQENVDEIRAMEGVIKVRVIM